MSALDREGFLANFDKMLESSVWKDPAAPDNSRLAKTNEKVVTQRLGEIANRYFQEVNHEPKNDHSAIRTAESLDLIARFFTFGKKRGWLPAEKVEKFHRLALDAGLVGESSRSTSSRRERLSSLGKLIDETYKTVVSRANQRDQSPVRRQITGEIKSGDEHSGRRRLHRHLGENQSTVEQKSLFTIINEMMDYSNKISAADVQKEETKRVHLAHIAETEDIEVIKTRGRYPKMVKRIVFKGGYSNYQLKKIMRSMVEVSEIAPKIMPKKLARLLEDTIILNVVNNQSSKDLYERWKAGKPILIDSGFIEHHVSMLVWRDKIIISNRGDCSLTDNEGKSMPVSSYTFSDDPSIFTIEIIGRIIEIAETGDDKSYVKLVTEELPGWLGFYQTELDKTIELYKFPEQIAANCAWANSEAGVFFLTVLYRLYEFRGRDHKIESINNKQVLNIIDKQVDAFENWQAYACIRELDKYLTWVKNPKNKFVPDFRLVERVFNAEIDQNIILPVFKDRWRSLEKEWRAVRQRIMEGKSPNEVHYSFGIHLGRFKFW